MVLAFLISLLTGITLRIPRSSWFTVGIVGMLGLASYRFIDRPNVPELVAAVTGGIVIGLLAEIMARMQKHPVTVYIVSGIIPLVPGITAYNSMLSFLNRHFEHGLLLAFKAFLIASYIAAGLAIAPLLVRSLQRVISFGMQKISR